MSSSNATGHTLPLDTMAEEKRVRVLFNGEMVADTRQPLLLREEGHPPVYYFPRSDIRSTFLKSSRTVTHCPYKGQADYWHVEVGGRTATDAVWAYEHPLSHGPDLSGYAALRWDAMDGWFEEDEEVFVHPKDPFVRVDTLQSSRHIEIVMDGIVVATTDRPVLLFETGLATRYYLPKLDVRMDLLRPSDTVTRCPYKGEARYCSVMTPRGPAEDVLWYYSHPSPGLSALTSRVCFYQERVDRFTVDGVALASEPGPE
ncbi:MAG TPA: DUF427 domain-containing protein [Gammaproteobacteria bacterium]|nr:DUF427 domain-containing protein [Gammaproteobacteria bacterium]